MCGIAGALAASPSDLIPAVVKRLTDALRHRGPDGEAYVVGAPGGGGRLTRERLPAAAALVHGHRRLSIVDLATGDQPMGNEDGSVWVAFNGEIYNHRELRALLERAGHRFSTQSDTEVLVHGWEQWGEDLLPRLNGIFAFALTDTRRAVTVLARDPAGVKPLYVGTANGFTWWASELSAVRAAGLVTGAVSPEALKLYLMFRYVPAPATILTNAWKLPPGHLVVLRGTDAGRAPEFRPFGTRVRCNAAPKNQDEWREALMTTLEAAVTRQLMSDVPVGSLLSGGVDSTLVTGLMARHLPYRPHAFGIGFRSDGDRSEALASGRAARDLGVPCTCTQIEDADYLALWPAAFAAASEPIANSGGLLLQALCRSVGATHKVVLTGQGADEPLGGYPRHMAERLWRIGRLAPRASAWIAERMFGAGAGRRLTRVMSAADRIDRYLQIFAVMEPEIVDHWVPGGEPAQALGRAAIGRWVEQGDSGDDLNDLLRTDARLSLADDLLLVADHAAMQASVELRVPFLDLEFLELAERMPSRYKVSAWGERKWLYRRAALREIPPPLRRRTVGWSSRVGRKVGFTAPLARWFAADGGPLDAARRWSEPLHGLLAPEALSDFLDHAADTPGEWQRELLALYALSRWIGSPPG